MRFALFSFLVFASLAFWTVDADFLTTYPFFGGDSFDWILNGLAMRGEDVRYTARPPFFPAMLAALDAVGYLAWAPWIGLAAACLVPVLLRSWLRRRIAPGLALWVALAVLFNHAWLGFSLEVMADLPAAALLFASALFFARGMEGNPWGYPLAGFLGGLSALTQQTALLLPLVAVVAVVIQGGRATAGSTEAGRPRPDPARYRELGLSGFLFLLPLTAWTVFKIIRFGTGGDVGVRNWSLLAPNLETWPFYAWALLSFLGLPGLLALVVGTVRGLRRFRSDASGTFVLTLTATLLAFFAFGYGFYAKRFLVYVFPFVALLQGEALHWISQRWGRWPATVGGVLLLLSSVQPLPGPWWHPRQVAVWPLPPVRLVAQIPADGFSRTATGPRRARLEVGRPGELWRSSVFYRASSGLRRGPPLHCPGPETFAGDDSVVYLQDPQEPRDERANLTSLGARTRRRVKVLPVSVADPWIGALSLRSLPPCGEAALFRTTLPGEGGSWVVAADAGHSAERSLQRQAADPAGGKESRVLEEARLRARKLSDYLPGRQPAVAVLPSAAGDDGTVFYLSFLIETPNLVVADPERREAFEAVLRDGTKGRSTTVAGVSIAEVEALGRRWVALRF